VQAVDSMKTWIASLQTSIGPNTRRPQDAHFDRGGVRRQVGVVSMRWLLRTRVHRNLNGQSMTYWL
jgi:hypothetical protein